MNAVAGPGKRYDLMSRRWSILGLTTAITVAVVGELLVRMKFPVNYQVVFMALSLGGLISFYFSSHIAIDDNETAQEMQGQKFLTRLRSYAGLVRAEKPFLNFTAMRFVFLSGTALATPLFPLYYVWVVNANDAQIGIISTVQTAILVVGYFFWSRQSRQRGSRFVLLCTTLMISLYPAVTAMTRNVGLLVVYAGLSGIFQAGIDLVFFDELMKTVPPKYSAAFVSLAQSLQYMSSVVAPLVGTLLADRIGIGGGLVVSAALRLIGFGLFALNPAARPIEAQPDIQARQG
jgi:Na+/melibiose symporter-like transporter